MLKAPVCVTIAANRHLVSAREPVGLEDSHRRTGIEMRTTREAQLQSMLAREPDFLRRQELLKALWRLAQQRDDLADRTATQTTRAAATSTAARSNRDESTSPRMAV